MIVRTPVKDFSGVVAGVQFADGVGESDDPNALDYFRRHGYAVDDAPKAEKPKAPARRASKAPKSES